MNSLLNRYLESTSKRVEAVLDRLLKAKSEEPESIRKAMRYSLFAGGKRLRPGLVAAGAECCGGRAVRVLKPGAALEMIHTYALIHDDLPAMDDDDLRRGKPTSHKVFGEALAILAGDGLLTLAFETAAANARECRLSGPATAELIRVIAAGAGTSGMVGGQVADLGAEKWRGRLSRPRAARLLEYIHLHKTGALITASLEAGAILARASAAQRRALRAYGRAIGLSFQVADDILDVVGDKKKLGKKGSDAANQKLTYVSLHGLERARAEAAKWTRRAHAALRPFGRRARVLHELADYIVTRDR
ncbi:MAG: polyprenyl synthetase family protein [Elusimicrobia bacterium]|nr:polyprenyl synthetase family protein [Elusimicrobiota bacterium]